MSARAKKLIAENIAQRERGEDATTLDLGRCGLTDLAQQVPELFELVWLEELALSNEWWDAKKGKRQKSQNEGTENHLSEIPPAFARLSALRTLRMGGERSAPWEISDWSFLASFPQLTSLDLSFNQISDFRFLEKLSGLTALDLSANPISDYSFLEKLSGLTWLQLEHNQISDIRFLEKLSGLTWLQLEHNQISDIRFLEKLTGLTLLDLGSNQISDLRGLEKLSGLTSLDLKRNQIRDLRILEKLSGLTSLNLGDNHISDISGLEKLTGLTSLDLGDNHISDISALEKLTGLTSLDLRFNKISDYSFLEKLSGLTSLDLSSNQISDIRGLKKLSGLTSLKLSNNKISDIHGLEKLTGLTSLQLVGNQISDIRGLEKLTGLTSLHLSINQISDLRGLEKLTGLTSLYLSVNQISDISGLKKLSGLTSLHLSINQISDLRPLKPIIHQLEHLELKGNPIPYLPKEIYDQGNCATDLRAYWQSLEEGQIALNQQLKVMFLGNGCVGKTTLLHWFLDGAFRDISLEEGRTHGIIIQPHAFPDSEVMAHFWDFGGQEVYHATHRLFLGRRTLYLLLWASETPEKDEELRHPPQYWLDMIADVADKGERSSVLVIQNRFEGQPERSLFDDEQRATYEAQGLDIHTFSVDAKGGRGVRPLLSTIQEAAEELVETYQEQLPQSWVDVRSAVAERSAAGEKTLPMEDFLEICQRAGKASAASTLLGYLHRAGELFHYPGRFGGQIILDQQWALKAVYAVLKRERIALYGGKFRVSDLIGFWRADDPQLSAEDAKTFLQFMLDNQTAFYAKDDAARGDDPELIIPQLLPEEAPPIIHSLEDIPGRLQHRVAYRFLHRDIISRFIVRTAHLSEQQAYWRQGIHIRQGPAKAAVFVDKDADEQPLLAIVCYGQGKEELLQRIREELDKIRPLEKAREYRFGEGAWQPYAAALSAGRAGKGGLGAASPAQEVGDLGAFFQPLNIFISYSKHDRKDYLEPLLRYLHPLVRGGWLVPWDDSQILPGEEWDDTIKQEIEQADVILLLVSKHSLSTGYIWNVEIEAAMQRHEAGTARVVPVILSKCLWEEKNPNGAYIFPPAKLNALPAKGRPVSEWERQEEAWDEVAQGVKRICTARKKADV